MNAPTVAATAPKDTSRAKGPIVWLDMDQQALDDAYDQLVYPQTATSSPSGASSTARRRASASAIRFDSLMGRRRSRGWMFSGRSRQPEEGREADRSRSS